MTFSIKKRSPESHYPYLNGYIGLTSHRGPQGNYFISELGKFSICMQYVFTLHANALNKILSHSVFVFVFSSFQRHKVRDRITNSLIV